MDYPQWVDELEPEDQDFYWNSVLAEMLTQAIKDGDEEKAKEIKAYFEQRALELSVAFAQAIAKKDGGGVEIRPVKGESGYCNIIIKGG